MRMSGRPGPDDASPGDRPQWHTYQRMSWEPKRPRRWRAARAVIACATQREERMRRRRRSHIPLTLSTVSNVTTPSGGHLDGTGAVSKHGPQGSGTRPTAEVTSSHTVSVGLRGHLEIVCWVVA